MAANPLDMDWPTYDGSAIGYYLFREQWWEFYNTHAEHMTLEQAAQVIVWKCFPPGDRVLGRLGLFIGYLDTVWEFLDGRYGHLIEILTFTNDGIWMLPAATEDVASILHLYQEAGFIDCAMLASPWKNMWRDRAITAMMYEKLPDSERIRIDLSRTNGPSEIPGQFIFEFMRRRVRELEQQQPRNVVVQVGTTCIGRKQRNGRSTTKLVFGGLCVAHRNNPIRLQSVCLRS